MEKAVKSKIAVFIFAINLLGVQCSQFQHSSDSTAVAQSSRVNVHGNTVKTKVKRNLDWSKRISALALPEVPVHVAAESENIQVTSKPTRIVRRMRIQHGGNQGVQTFREINPDFRSADGRKKVIKIKKIRRKPLNKSTADDGGSTYTNEITTIPPATTTTTTTSTTEKPTTIYPKITPSPSYSHITVINKETVNPKKNKKNKKKNHKHQLVPTPPYDTRVKHNGFDKTMDYPEMYFSPDSEISVHNYNERGSYPDYGYYNKREPYTSGNKLKERPTVLFANPQMRFDSDITRTVQLPPNYAKDAEPLSNPIQYVSNRKRSSLSQVYVPQNDDKLMELESTVAFNKDTLKESSSQLKDIRNDFESNSTSALPKTNNSTEVPKQRVLDSSTELPLAANKSVESAYTNETDNTTVSNPNKTSEINSSITDVPKDSDVEGMTQKQDRFPSRYPSLLYGKQNAFSDPYFDNTEFSPPLHRNRPSIAPWKHLFSPFDTSDDTPGEGYLYDDEHHTDDLAVPGFRHSPQFTSLRRSIIHTYDEDETTTSEPVTPFSLPKFEMPSIDFNDKGCQTVYKEVKTVPGNGPESRNSNAKSFVMTRECYFPNGVPTTEETHTDLMPEDSVTEKVESKTS